LSDKDYVTVVIDESRCARCGLCEEIISCPGPERCIGCLACVPSCPEQARIVLPDTSPRRQINITVDGQALAVPEHITVKRALEMSGYSFGITPGEGDIAAPCNTGGCWACMVQIDGQPARSCISPVAGGMAIQTVLPPGQPPLRIIHGPQPHTVGGKATPWWLKARIRYVEVAIWGAGCNLRCPQCQNFTTTYHSAGTPVSPQKAARSVARARHFYGVDRIAFSGGEATLNRPWLIQFFQAVRELDGDPELRLHLDSNGTLLTPDYLDELILDAGITDIGIEPKGPSVETLMRISGIEDPALAGRYLDTAWQAIAHVVERHRDRVFLGVGMPYNRDLVSFDEVEKFGRRLASIDANVQLCVLDYFPTFRRRHLRRPEPAEMLAVKQVLEGTGLRTVIVQTTMGHLGP
jgi:pyruvate formate lyase activating enzyme